MHRRRLLDHPAGNLVNTGDARLLAFASNSKRRRKSSTLVGKHVPDSDPGSIPAPTTVTRTTTAQGRKRNVALGLVPSQGWGAWHRRHLTLPSTNAPNFHTVVCRHQPARAIGTKACPGLRIRHSRGSGNPEGKGGTNHTQTPPTTRSHFHTSVCRRLPAWAIGTKACPGLRSGMNSGTGRRRQPTSPKQRLPRVARKM